MTQYENIDMEFKEIYTPGLKKDVVAFANTEGGTIHIGIRKDGEAVGVEDADGVMLQVAGALRDSIRPDIMPFVQIRATEKENRGEKKTIIEIEVQVGAARPYYLYEKGLKPSGVYVRKGSASQPLGDEGIRAMIVQNSGRSYERERSMNQQLTFDTLEKKMEDANIKLGTAQMRTLHMIGEDGLFTNLALLLSDQCEHTIKVAIFQGQDKAVFRDRKEFSGSLLQQLSDVYQFLDFYNGTKATFSGLDRTDTRDYPQEAIREALLNSIVHRDYSFSGSTLINLYDDRIEFVSLGGLVPGLAKEAIFMGVSQSRNPELAGVLYRMRLIESYGTGISKIRCSYDGEKHTPTFETAEGVFRTTLPNRNTAMSKLYISESADRANAGKVKETPVEYKTSREANHRNKKEQIHREKQLILDYAAENDGIVRKDVEELLDIKTTKAFLLLRELCQEGMLVAQGNGKLSRYIPVEKL